MRDLAAFTANVRLKSVFTTHVGASVLGIGRFYSVACVAPKWWSRGFDPASSGTIVLKATGAVLTGLSAGSQAPPHTLLAWDQSTEFSIAQELSLVGVWFAPPDVKAHSECSSLKHGVPDSPLAPLLNCGKLLRYLFLPF